MTITAFSPLDHIVTDAPTRQAAPLSEGADGYDRTLWIDRAPNRYPARVARAAAYAAGWDWALPADQIDDLVSIVDALVVNALIHAKWSNTWPCVQLRLANTGRRVIVEVRDPDPTLPIWPTARPMDIASLIDDPTIGADDSILIHRQGLVDVAGRAELTAHQEPAGKVVRASFKIGGGK